MGIIVFTQFPTCLKLEAILNPREFTPTLKQIKQSLHVFKFQLSKLNILSSHFYLQCIFKVLYINIVYSGIVSGKYPVLSSNRTEYSALRTISFQIDFRAVKLCSSTSHSLFLIDILPASVCVDNCQLSPLVNWSWSFSVPLWNPLTETGLILLAGGFGAIRW